jgi:hypothetical protein
MEEGVQKAVGEFRKNPEAVSKKTEEAIKQMGVKPNTRFVENWRDRWWRTDRRVGTPGVVVDASQL